MVGTMNKSAPKLKADFMHLYKGIYQNGSRKTPSTNSRPVLITQKKSAPMTLPNDTSTEKINTRGSDAQNKSINSLFRTLGKLDSDKEEAVKANNSPGISPKPKSRAEQKPGVNSNIIFNTRNISKGMSLLPIRYFEPTSSC
jgi:hypothetical protein